MGRVYQPTLSQLDGLIGLVSFLYDHERRAAIVAEFREELVAHEASHERYESENVALIKLREDVQARVDAIAERETTFASREAGILAAEAALGQRETNVTTRENDIAIRERTVGAINAENNEKARVIARKENDVAAAAANLDAREADVAEREKELAPLMAIKAQLAGKNG